MTARWAWQLAPTVAWAGIAVVIGLVLAVLPVKWAGLAVAGLLILALALWRPMIAIACAVGLGITKAYLARLGYGGFLFDLGQIFTGVALVGWAARKLLRRDLSFRAPALLIPLGLFALVGAASLLDALSYADGLPELIKWLQIMAIVVVVVDEASEIDWRWLVVGLCALAVVQGGLGLVQYLGRGASLGFPPDLLESFRIGPDRFRAFGTFEQPNPYAGFVGLVWPIAAGAALGLLAESAKRRGWLALTALRPIEWAQLVLFLAAAGLGLAGLYGSVSRGGWIGAAGAAAVMAVLLPRRWGWSISAVVGVAAVAGLAWSLNLVPANIAARLTSATDFIGVQDVRGVTISNDNFAVVERLAHWQAAFSMIQDRPWLGVGLGNYAAAYDRYRLVNWPNALGHAHNIYLNVWAETGLFGLVTYFALWAAVVWITLRGLRRSAGLERGVLLGLMGAWTHLSLHQLFDNLYVNNMHLLLAALLGLLAYVYGKQRTTLNAVLAAARRQPTERKRFIKFLIVGAIGFIVDFGGFNLFHAFGVGRSLATLIPTGLPQIFDFANHPEIIEQSLSFACAVLSNFIWNYFWIYPEARGANQAKKITKFFIVSVAGLIVGVPVFTLALALWQPVVAAAGLQAMLPAGVKLNIAGNLALMTRVGTLMLWNFFVNRYWTYRDVKR